MTCCDEIRCDVMQVMEMEIMHGFIHEVREKRMMIFDDRHREHAKSMQKEKA